MAILDDLATSATEPTGSTGTTSGRAPTPVLRWSIWMLGTALPLIGLFLPWISIRVGHRRALTVSGLDLGLEDNWVTGTGEILVSTHWLYLIAAAVAASSAAGLVTAAFRSRAPRMGQSTALIVSGTLAFGVIVARLKNAHDIAEDVGVSLESRLGLQLSLAGMALLVAAGFLAYRVASQVWCNRALGRRFGWSC